MVVWQFGANSVSIRCFVLHRNMCYLCSLTGWCTPALYQVAWSFIFSVTTLFLILQLPVEYFLHVQPKAPSGELLMYMSHMEVMLSYQSRWSNLLSVSMSSFSMHGDCIIKVLLGTDPTRFSTWPWCDCIIKVSLVAPTKIISRA